MSFFEDIYACVGRIPRGKVASYGQIARAAGRPRAARAVGNALHVNPRADEIPCHRVVNHAGRLAPSYAFGGMGEQKRKLIAEGVVVNDDGYVDMKVYRYEMTNNK